MRQEVDLPALAEALHLSRRRVQQLNEQGIIVELPDGKFDLRESKRRYRVFKNGDIESPLGDLAEIAEDLEQGLAAIYAEESVEERRLLAREIGPLIGRLDSAFALANALAPPHARRLLNDHAHLLIGRLIDDLFSACQWTISSEMTD